MTGPVSLSAPLSGFALAGDTLDRADALRDDADALARLWPSARVLILDDEGRALAQADGALLASEGASLGGGPGASLFLGLRDGVAWFAAHARHHVVATPAWLDLRRAAALWPSFESGVFAMARALLHWQSSTRFCSACGGDITFRRAGYIAHCTRCGKDHYPRVDPAVIVAVSDGERLLLGRQAAWPPRRYSVVAGFVEPGETLEQTVAREVLEETQVRVRGCRYLGAQPWPFPGALMLGFCAEAEPDVPQVDGELEDARWFPFDDIDAALARDGDDDGESLLLSPSISIARALIEHWHAGMRARRASTSAQTGR
ncbi:NAD(+) diphosphatase [Pseudoxanthomonas sp.]|uniref:NAD(+) diphosphatase n=1 Tax=Pseudoxanthomonas sp. TaxID=1871049 RepID=UPI0028C3DEDC|nr:NAD(+) diphosphatase [Pseudoxanthomonas sp.]